MIRQPAARCRDGDVAMQQGRYAARAIRNELEAPPQTFRYRYLGQFATIGRTRALYEVVGFDCRDIQRGGYGCCCTSIG